MEIAREMSKSLTELGFKIIRFNKRLLVLDRTNQLVGEVRNDASPDKVDDSIYGKPISANEVLAVWQLLNEVNGFSKLIQK